MEPDGNTHILNEDIVANVIAELIVDTRSEDVRSALRIYKFKKSIKQLEREYTSLTVAQLKATLSHLNVPDDVEYLKHELVTNLICRIQNLLPEKCSICSETYCIQNDDKPFLPCSKCGQEAHKECIMTMLNTSESDDEEDLDHKALMEELNPFNIGGFHYLCKSCEETNIPSKTSARKTRKKKKTEEQTTSTQVSSNGSNSQDESDTPPPQPRDQSQNVAWVDVPEEEEGELEEEEEPEEEEQKDDEPEVVAKPELKTCRFYRSGSCKHGISGKGCEFEHPKMCDKLLKHGTRQPQGCNKGTKCDKFHPKMCPTSISKLECFDKKCKLRHVRGTKR